MTVPPKTSRLSRDRLGLVIIVASLLGIAIICVLILNRQNEQRLADMRTEGVNLVQLLGRLSFADLINPEGSSNILEALVYAGSNDYDALLYAAVVDLDGNVKQEASVSGVFAPVFRASQANRIWTGEQVLQLQDGKREVLEFYGPLNQDNELAGYVRVGYLLPNGMELSQLPFLATLALIVFLLTTLLYMMFRLEIRPINQLKNSMANLIDNGALQTVAVPATGEMAEFMQRFNTLMALAKKQIKQLEDKETSLVASKKLINYRRHRVERVLDSLSNGVLVLDENGSTTYVSSKMAHHLGKDVQYLRSTDIAEWLENVEFIAFVQEVRGRCHDMFSIDPIEIASPSSADKTLMVSSRRVVEGGGAVIIVSDVTREVLARRSRGEFVAHVAHELKTPLNTLSLYSESLQGEDGADLSFRLEATNIISDEVERLNALIGNLLSITRIEMGSLSLSRSLVKPRQLLTDAMATAQRGCRKPDMKFELLLPTEISPIYADKDTLRVAINNLLTNAIKYNRDDGTVTLSAEENEESFVIKVSDTGIGISPEDQQKIFDKFYRSDDDEVRSRTGHGLGLALARDIVQIHNGMLEVDSVPGKGSEFRLVLWKDACAVRQAI